MGISRNQIGQALQNAAAGLMNIAQMQEARNRLKEEREQRRLDRELDRELRKLMFEGNLGYKEKTLDFQKQKESRIAAQGEAGLDLRRKSVGLTEKRFTTPYAQNMTTDDYRTIYLKNPDDPRLTSYMKNYFQMETDKKLHDTSAEQNQVTMRNLFSAWNGMNQYEKATYGDDFSRFRAEMERQINQDTVLGPVPATEPPPGISNYNYIAGGYGNRPAQKPITEETVKQPQGKSASGSQIEGLGDADLANKFLKAGIRNPDEIDWEAFQNMYPHADIEKIKKMIQ